MSEDKLFVALGNELGRTLLGLVYVMDKNREICTLETIMKHINANPNTLNHRLTQLCDAEVIRKTESGFVVAHNGMKFLEKLEVVDKLNNMRSS